MAVQAHGSGEVLEDGNSLYVEVTKHGVTLPAAEESNEVAVDACGDKGHCARGAQGLDCAVVGVEAQEGGGLTEEYINGGGRNPKESPSELLVVAMDGGVGICTIASEVNDSSGNGSNWAEDGVAASGVSDFFSSDGILLLREGEHAERRR